MTSFHMGCFRITTLAKRDVERFLDDYYEKQGLDKRNGIPASSQVGQLGLDDFVSVIER